MLHLAERYPGLLLNDPHARARATAGMFAALNTIEPPILEREIAIHVEPGKPWFEARLPLLEDRIRTPLSDLATWLADGEWLEGSFKCRRLAYW